MLFEFWKKYPRSICQPQINLEFLLHDYYDIKIERRMAISAAPSTNAAIRIIAERMSPDASGCLAIASIALPPTIPIPIPAPITARPAPIAAKVPVILLNVMIKKN